MLRAPFFAVALLVGAGYSAAETATFAPSKDNTLYEEAAGATSNGAGDYLFVGRTGQPQIRRALIAFDLSSIPTGSAVTRVTLSLHMSRTISGAQTLHLRRVLTDWGEGTSNSGGEEGGGAPATSRDATWKHTFWNTASWSQPGGDFSATTSASTSVGDVGRYTWASTAQMVADVQAWVDNSADNFGWVLLGNETSTRNAKRFDSRQHPTPSQRPVLTVEYTPPALNQAPVLNNPPPTRTFISGDAPFTFDLASPALFTDADGDSLAYTAASSDTAVVGVALSGTRLTLTPRSRGSATIALKASDGRTGSASTSFAVEVEPKILSLTGDFNGDQTVNFDDFFLFADHFGRRTGDTGFDAAFDLDADADVDFDDFFLFADHFGEKTP